MTRRNSQAGPPRWSADGEWLACTQVPCLQQRVKNLQMGLHVIPRQGSAAFSPAASSRERSLSRQLRVMRAEGRQKKPLRGAAAFSRPSKQIPRSLSLQGKDTHDCPRLLLLYCAGGGPCSSGTGVLRRILTTEQKARGFYYCCYLI